MDMNIGAVQVEPPLALAPMAGITTSCFRRLVKGCGGCGVVWTELVSANAVVFGSRKTAELLRFCAAERPIAFQLFGAEPATVAEATRRIVEYQPDILDINMGCPVRKVVGAGAGAALLADPPRAEAVVRQTVAAAGVPVTVKFRSLPGARLDALVAFARMLENAGAAALVVHARTPAQKHAGPARWDDIRAVKEAVGVPVIGNGGVRAAQDAVRMMRQTGCDAVMVGMAARGDPWIFARIAALLADEPEPPLPTPKQRIAMALRHAEALAEEKGERTAVCEMRAHVGCYIRGMPGARQIRESANRVCSLAQLRDLLRAASERTCQDTPAGVPPQGATAA
jgi:tRNA-dihydrouridine synthase B